MYNIKLTALESQSSIMAARLPTAVQSSVFLIAAVVASHWAAAMSMVFINKNLVSGQDIHGDISVFIVWVQNMVGVLILLTANVLARLINLKWTLPGLHLATLLHPDMIMASITFTGTLVFNNLMLKYISVAFYQVARSLTLIFVITFSIFILQEKVTSRIILSCMFIIAGFYIGVDVEMVSQGVHPVGVLYGVMASLFAALSGVFFKRVQKKEGLTSVQLTFNNCIISSVGLTPLIFTTSQINNFFSSPAAGSGSVWIMLIISGFMSLIMGWISSLQISLTSPLTHNISINAKSLFQTILAVVWSGESRAWLWWIGNGLVMAGIATYTANKLLSTSQQNAAHDVDLEIREPVNGRFRLPSSSSDCSTK